LISQAPAAPYPVVDPVVQSPSPMEQQLAAQLRIEQTRADAYEADALQARLYRERIRKNDPGYKGVPEDYPRRKTEVVVGNRIKPSIGRQSTRTSSRVIKS